MQHRWRQQHPSHPKLVCWWASQTQQQQQQQ
jgi:hypothetical protein